MKILLLLFICVTFCGCVTARKEYSKSLAQVIHIGMTKEQVIKNTTFLNSFTHSSPTAWSKQNINGHIYETWVYIENRISFDFVDNSLTGYSLGLGGIAYYSKDGIEDTRNYPK